jgi:hypothetical protein
MSQFISNKRTCIAPSFTQLWKPIQSILPEAPQLKSGCNRPLKFDFEHQLKTLVFSHIEEHDSAQHLLQVLEEDDYARKAIAPEKGIKKSSFSEAINTRGLEQLIYIFNALQKKAGNKIPKQLAGLGDLVAIDGSLINACLSMLWADYRGNSQKAKVHLGFDINRSIPKQVFLTNGKGGERPFVSQILEPGETGVLDRGYQDHENFDILFQRKASIMRVELKRILSRRAFKHLMSVLIVIFSMMLKFFWGSLVANRPKMNYELSVIL